MFSPGGLALPEHYPPARAAAAQRSRRGDSAALDTGGSGLLDWLRPVLATLSVAPSRSTALIWNLR
jgi:hypothetical protein